MSHPTDRGCDERPLTLRVSGWEIPAALTLPPDTGDAGATLPGAILLIPGSLFSNVDGDYPVWSSRPHVYAHLARQLSARGHAVLRFAKMGPGTGSVAVDPEASARVRTWEGRTVIARGALDAMRQALADAGLRAERTVLAGHSEGAVVASMMAADGATPGVDGVVLLAGPSVGILEIMREQVPRFVPPAQADEAREAIGLAIDHVRRLAPIPPELAARPGVGGLAAMPLEGYAYLRDSDATDPEAAAARIPHPVLIVQGGRDESVLPHHAERLRDARRGRPTEYRFFPELQHMMKPLPDGMSGPAAFSLEGPTDERVTDAIDDWIRRLPRG